MTLSSVAFSQEKNDEKLQKIMKNADDTSGINALMNYGVDLINVDNKKAIRIFTVSLEKSQRINYDYGIGSSYARLGYIEGHEGRHAAGIDFTKKALAHFIKINRIKGITLCYINLGFNYNILAMPDSALHYFFEGITLLEKTKSEPGKLARLYENVGNTFGNRKELDKAVEYAQKAIKLALSIHDSDYIVTAWTSLSNSYTQSQQYEKGLDAVLEAKKYLPVREDPILAEKVYSKMASAYVGLQQADAAIAAATKAMQYSAATAPDYYIAAGLNLASAYELKKDYKNELRVLIDLQHRAESNNNLFHLFAIYDQLAQVNALTGNYSDAYLFKSKHAAYKDSFFTEQNSKNIAEIETRYKTAEQGKALSEKQLQLTQKELDLKKSNQFILITVAGIVVTALLALLLYLQARNRKKAYRLQLVAIQQRKERDMLQALMEGEETERARIARDLHDGVAGMLAAAKMHISNSPLESSNAENIMQIVSLLDTASAEIRKTSHNLMPEVLLQHGLDEALRRYCGNISSSKLTVQYDSWGDPISLNATVQLAIYRTVQELLNNVVKHAGATEAMVQFSHQNGLLSIAVQDNGIGFSAAEENHTGMGLRNLDSRVRAIQGRLDIETAPGKGVSAYLEFETARSA
ncbi:putative two-component histidine kinase [Flavihumibacter petaseus NBRC 106054]|uniref:Putative two-component histidine kinase n=2 Tax=Flavihumibacter TaxID=1004301 RepID=A0A0E9N2H9_9BACT|nr:putative two-component histidine kinase [Flavihumibacter petaseus NBRC 106054]